MRRVCRTCAEVLSDRCPVGASWVIVMDALTDFLVRTNDEDRAVAWGRVVAAAEPWTSRGVQDPLPL